MLRTFVIALMLCALGVDLASAQTAARFEGTLSVIWGNPRPGQAGGETRFELALADGTTRRLQISDDQRNTAIRYFGKRVVVQGRTTTDAFGAPRLAVDQITTVSPADANPSIVKGTRRVLFLLLKFSGDAQEPHKPSFYASMTNPKTSTNPAIPATINGFFNKTSWNTLKWKADVGGKGGLNPTDWLTLPKSKTGYAPCGWTGVCANLTGIQNDGMKLAIKAGIDVSVYDNINFVLNNDLDCCAWGGGFTYSGNGKFYGATWEPPWGQETGTYSHELGHSIGLPHSGWVYYAYDSPWDVMSMAHQSAKNVQCATYKSANSGNATNAVFCSEPGDGYIAAHKDVLGWIPAANQILINSKSSKTVTLEADALPLGGGIKMIKVCINNKPCSGASAHYLTVEARIRGTQFDNGIPGDGVIIHGFLASRSPIGGSCFFNSQSGWAMPIDATPKDYSKASCTFASGKALYNAQFLVGDTYKDTALGITIKVIRKNGSSSYDVKVVRSN